MTCTLEQFLQDYDVCRVWYCGLGSPAGDETILNEAEDAGDDYCSIEDLMFILEDLLRIHDHELEGEVTADSGGEFRWEVSSLEDIELEDGFGNLVYNLVVWGE